MLFFATMLRNFRQSHHKVKFSAEGYKKDSYPAHMGFFQTFGLNFGCAPGHTPGNTQYVPITALSLQEVEVQAGNNYEDERETLERHAAKLAAILVRNSSDALHETLTYSLREIFRNVLEHSGADTIWYAAQCWADTRRVELAILDEGVGIASSLLRNPHLTIQTDFDALSMSLLPGISGVAYRGGPKQRKDAWANSGYGLYMTSQLSLRGGTFVIISGSGGLYLADNVEHKLEIPPFRGTAIRLQFDIDRISDLSESLNELRTCGSKIAGNLKEQANITASMSSRMLFGARNN